MFGPAPAGEVWTGDDAAVIRTSTQTLVTTDSIAEHVDFELDWATGADIGFKLVAINVSDIAAMGGRPSRAVATVQLGETTSIELVDDIAAGMAEAATRWDLGIAGGDIGRGFDLALTLTLLGEIEGQPVLRSGARLGDSICVTGALGASSAGLLALQLGAVSLETVRSEIDTSSGADGLAVLAARQLRPTPRLEEGNALRNYATAMIDISDGFALDLERLCRASNAGCEVDSSAIPLHPELAHAEHKIEGSPDPLELALTGGEDLELLFTVTPDRLEDVHRALDELGTQVSVVGKITEGGRSIDGRPLDDWSKSGWDHLRTR